MLNYIHRLNDAANVKVIISVYDADGNEIVEESHYNHVCSGDFATYLFTSGLEYGFKELRGETVRFDVIATNWEGGKYGECFEYQASEYILHDNHDAAIKLFKAAISEDYYETDCFALLLSCINIADTCTEYLSRAAQCEVEELAEKCVRLACLNESTHVIATYGY